MKWGENTFQLLVTIKDQEEGSTNPRLLRLWQFADDVIRPAKSVSMPGRCPNICSINIAHMQSDFTLYTGVHVLYVAFKQ